MTLAQTIVDDVKDVYLVTDDFAETITYTPDGGAAKSIKAIVDRNEDVEPNPALDGLRRVRRYEILISTNATDGIATVTDQDTVAIDGLTFIVEGRPKRVGGMQKLSLVEHSVVEKSHQEYRIVR